jgi:hypothetical protein
MLMPVEKERREHADRLVFDVTLLKTFSLIGVIFLHAALPFTVPEGFWKFYAPWQSALVEAFKFWGGLVLIPSFMLASGYLAALSVYCQLCIFLL